MDWIRRNWPDLLIGVALVAVIALIVATLLSGGSMVSLLQRGTAPELPITTTTGPAGGQRGTGTTRANADSHNAGPTQQETPAATDGRRVDVFVPGVSGTTGSAAPNGTGEEDSAPAEANTNQGAPAQSGNQAAQPSNAANVNTPLPESVPNGGFRVAAGAVNSRDGAIGSAETLREADYTVTIEQQDDLYLLWVGPYASRAGAERVAERLSDDGLVPDALVYTYDPNEGDTEANNDGPGANSTANTTPGANGGANAATPAQNSSPTTVQSGAAGAGTNLQQATGAATTGELTAPAGQRFLQVGAFGSEESAEPQRQQLEGLGLSVTRREDDNGVIRLYVGPFAGAQLAQTQNRLDTQGIDSFPVTP